MSNNPDSKLERCPLDHYVSAGLRVNKTDPKIICLDCGLTLAATDWVTLYERWHSRSRASVAAECRDPECWLRTAKPAAASSSLPAEPPQSHGVQVIAAERQRHFDVEGWTLEHDDEHTDESLAQAAACYAWPRMRPLFVKQAWPWQPHEWKPEIYGVPGATDSEKRDARIRVLAKAGALIAAEIDRLERIK